MDEVDIFNMERRRLLYGIGIASAAFSNVDSGPASNSLPVGRNASPVSILDFGAKCDGVTDDAFAIKKALESSAYVIFPSATIFISSSIVFPPEIIVEFRNTTIKCKISGPAFHLDHSKVCFLGRVKIDCENFPGSIGLQIGSGKRLVTESVIEWIQIRNASAAGVYLYSDGNKGVYYHWLKKAVIKDSAVGVLLKTERGGKNATDVNANHFSHLMIQRCIDGIVIDGAWGTDITYLEAELNTGNAIWLKKGFRFSMAGGWIEDNKFNIRIEDHPEFHSVYINASIDSPLDATDKKFICRDDGRRSLFLKNSTYSKWLGRAQFSGDLRIGAFGAPGNDQGGMPDGSGRLKVAAQMDCFRKAISYPYFNFCGASETGFSWTVDNNREIVRFDPDGSAVRVRGGADLVVDSSNFRTGRLVIGENYIWTDKKGRLRMKQGAPQNDDDGAVIGGAI